VREEGQLFFRTNGHPRVFKLASRNIEVDVEVIPFAHFFALRTVVALFGVGEEFALVLPVYADV